MKLWSSAGVVVATGAGVGVCGSVGTVEEFEFNGDAAAGTVTEADRVGAVTSWAKHVDEASDIENRAVAKANLWRPSEMDMPPITGAGAIGSPYGKR
jgi:hypothetical protein